ncbi:MAG: hypothetical protein ACRDQ5_15570, partial [Sciscionella sp.]
MHSVEPESQINPERIRQDDRGGRGVAATSGLSAGCADSTDDDYYAARRQREQPLAPPRWRIRSSGREPRHRRPTRSWWSVAESALRGCPTELRVALLLA